jgi:hypothetical protein
VSPAMSDHSKYIPTQGKGQVVDIESCCPIQHLVGTSFRCFAQRLWNRRPARQ